MNENLAVYTVCVGDGFSLPEIYPADGVEYLCFTDNPKLEAKGWKLKVINPIFQSDLIRSSREPKIRPHRHLQDFSRSLYIDTRVQLKKDPKDLWQHLTGDHPAAFAAFYHSFHATLQKEFKAVLKIGLDDESRVNEMRTVLERNLPIALSERFIWGGILARRHHEPECIEAMETWYAHVLRYSRRDQLSLPLAVNSIQPPRVRLSTIDNHENDFFCWPINTFKPDRYFDHRKEKKSLRKVLKKWVWSRTDEARLK